MRLAVDIFRVRASEPGMGGDVEFAAAACIGTSDDILEFLETPEISGNFQALVYEVSEFAEEYCPVYT